ncbi:MAG: FAD-dependent oxidoreductase [Pirellulales bacterium]
MNDKPQPVKSTVVILGAGINGVAIARELLLSGLSVTLIDKNDFASGTTPYSSRLIHGGLRYLEYAEFSLVKESLHERNRLLRLAPHLVKPLKLLIPTQTRFSGMVGSALKFLGLSSWVKKSRPRGSWIVGIGLKFYDWFSADKVLPKHRHLNAKQYHASSLNHKKYRSAFQYFDAQIVFPERFVLSMLVDAQQIAEESPDVKFRILTHCDAQLEGNIIKAVSNHPHTADEKSAEFDFHPDAIINATGAWVDHCLQKIQIDSERLIGGTKGSHLISYHPKLLSALNTSGLVECGIYAEAADGRPFFILPWNHGCLIGTTDIHFEGNPADAIAEQDEVNYLIQATNDVFPDVQLTRTDVQQHYCGVRPLPYVDAASAGAISRSHQLHRHQDSQLPVYSVIGGKLTTCRALAEETAQTILNDLSHAFHPKSRDRFYPGGEDLVDLDLSASAERFGLTIDTVQLLYELEGSRVDQVLAACFEQQADSTDGVLLVDTLIPIEYVHYCVDHYWCSTLADLVERRLMLIYQQNLTLNTLTELAQVLCQRQFLDNSDADIEVEQYAEQILKRFGKKFS